MTQPQSNKTLLDTIETSVHRAAFRSSSNGERLTVTTAQRLVDNAVYPSQLIKAERMSECTQHLWIAMDEEGPCVTVSQCHQRGCPECDAIRGKLISHHVEARISTYRAPKLLTLTLKPRDCSLRDQITFLLHSFHSLRRCDAWKRLVRGGVYVLEITRNALTMAWHVHLHAVIDSKYLPHEWLSPTWERITGGSMIVHITKADKHAAKYLSKYVGKVSDLELEDYELWPFRDELRGKRLVGSFGAEPALNSADPGVSGKSYPLMSLHQLIELCKDGDQAALEMLDALTKRYPRLFRAPTARDGGDARQPAEAGPPG